MNGRDKKLRIIFVNYGAFRSNSGGHILNFANELTALGHIVAVCATGEFNDPDYDPKVRIHAFSHDDVVERPAEILNCGEEERATILHLWTPREKVLQLARLLNIDGALPVFIHLEDNEDVIAATNLGIEIDEIAKIDPKNLPNPYPASLSHPYRYRKQLEQANGVTTIVEKLGEFVPSGVSTTVLEPGVDTEKFQDVLTEEQKLNLKTSLNIKENHHVFVYHGNMHAANQREIFSLYTTAIILMRRNFNVSLIRTGFDYCDGLDVSYAEYLKKFSINLGFVDTNKLVEILSLADFFVQPGCSNAFNDYRFPSKIPEFLSMGKPTILPNTNIATQLRNGEDALFLNRGDGLEIADCVESILTNADLSSKLSINARKFAKTALNWRKNAESLVEFYRENLR